jgi:zinc transport system permease protein
MMDWMDHAFMQRALLASIMVGSLASYYGVFVVQRRLSFLGSGLSHAAFGGVALGLLLEAEPLIVAIPFTIAVALTINWLRRHTRLAGDTAIGVMFAVSVAMGVIFISGRVASSTDTYAYLFGSVLAVSEVDLWAIVAMVLVAAATIPSLWGRWAYATFDQEMAETDKLHVYRDDQILSVLLAVTIVVSIKIAGILLLAAFLVIPAASSRLISSTFRNMTIIAVLIGSCSAAFGLAASFYFDLPSGATIVLCQAAFFLISLKFSSGSGSS